VHIIATPFRIVLLFILIAAGSLLVIPNLKVDLLPIEKTNQLQIIFWLPQQSSPEIVEQQVTSLLEGAFSQLTQLKNISSTSYYGNGRITLDFDKSANIALKQFEVAALLRRIYPQLPAGCTYPLISRGNPENNASFLVYTIRANEPAFEIKKKADEVFKKTLAGLPGISNLYISGPENLQVTIQYDINKLRALGLSPDQISKALHTYSDITYPGSILTKSGDQFFIRIPSTIHTLDDLENITLTTSQTQIIRLKEISTIFLEEHEPQGYLRVNGQTSIILAITAHEGENKILLANHIKRIIHDASLHLPGGYYLKLDYDQTDFLKAEMSKNYRRTGLSISILLLFILLSYRSWRYLLVLFSGIIVNLSLTTILVFLLGININIYTIAGMAVSFGIMIDNTIVMVDYYHRRKNRKIFLALLGATATTIGALCLVFFLPEKDQNNLMDFSIVIILALLSSIVVALWFVPSLQSLLFSYKPKSQVHPVSKAYRMAKTKVKFIHSYFRFIQFISRYRKTFFVLLIWLFGLPTFLLPGKWEGNRWYHHWYNSTLGSENYQENISPYINKWLGGSLGYFVREVYEGSGNRDPENTVLHINASLPYGSTVEQMNYILKDFEKYLSSVEGIDIYVTRIYSGQNGNIEIQFKEGYDKSSLPTHLKSRLVSRSLDWGGVDWIIYGIGQGFTNMGSGEIPAFQVLMKGYNYDELENQANKLAQKLLKNRRVKKINTNAIKEEKEKGSTQYFLAIDKATIILSGSNQTEVMNTVLTLSKPTGSNQSIILNNSFYPVYLKETNTDHYSSYDLLNNPLVLAADRQVGLKNIGKLELRATSNNIHKIDREYIRVLGFEYVGTEQVGSEFLRDILRDFKDEMPIGYTAEREFIYQNWEVATRHYFLIFILILADFFICSILFESIKKPFYIIAVIPVSFIGLFLVFALGGFPFDQGGYAAFVMLGGLVVNAAIFIVNDFINLCKRNPNVNYNRLLIKATVKRSRTILLTTASACCGLVPFLLEGQNEVFWFSFAIGTMGGLIFSMLAVFVLLPVMLWKSTGKKNSG
jgi:multidrug efflux pump subunit AcrB